MSLTNKFRINFKKVKIKINTIKISGKEHKNANNFLDYHDKKVSFKYNTVSSLPSYFP